MRNPCKILFGKFCWPIRSIRDISGVFVAVWDLKHFNFAGKLLRNTLTVISELIGMLRGHGLFARYREWSGKFWQSSRSFKYCLCFCFVPGSSTYRFRLRAFSFGPAAQWFYDKFSRQYQEGPVLHYQIRWILPRFSNVLSLFDLQVVCVYVSQWCDSGR